MKSKEHSTDAENNTQMPNQSEENQPVAEALPDSETEEKDPVTKMEVELTEWKDKYLRMYSEFENYKKRVSRDKIEITRMAGSDIFLAILPVIDDFERALKSTEKATDVNQVRDGVQLIYSKLKNISEAKGLKPMDSIGKPFDPDLHDAITNAPAPSEDMKGKVLDEVEKGYFLNDKVIRHAKVIVGS